MTEQDVRKAEEYQRFINDPVWQEMYEHYRSRIVSMLESADIDDDRRRKLNYLLVAGAQFRKHAEAIVEFGKAAAEEIEKRETAGERIGRMFRRVA